MGHNKKPSRYGPMHQVDLQCRVDRLTEGSCARPSPRPRAIRVATAGRSDGSYAWTGGAREAVGENFRALKDSSSNVATGATTDSGTGGTTRVMSAALSIEMTRITA